jgi:drug/metabolite transporter (DMT)-like permease
MPHTKNAPAIAGLLFAATCWGLIWYPYRLLEEGGVSGVWSTFLTYLIAGVLGVAFFRRGLSSFAFSGWALPALALAAGWTNLGYVLAVLNGEVVRVLLLFYLAPLWTVLLARLILNERLNIFGYSIIVLSLAGAFTMLWQPGTLPLPANAGEWYGLTAGMGFATANVLTRFIRHAGVPEKSLAVWFGVTLLCLPLVFLQAPLRPPLAGETVVLLAGVGLVLFAMTLAVQYGLTHTPANQAIVIFLFELVVAAVSSWWWADETLDAREWIGGGMIIAASLFSDKMVHHEN